MLIYKKTFACEVSSLWDIFPSSLLFVLLLKL